MPTPTLIPGDHQEDTRNPGQQDYDRRFNDIAHAEEQGSFDDIVNNYDKTADDSQENANIQKIQNLEKPEWKTSINPSSATSNKRYQWGKKKGPIAAILTILGIGGFGLSTLFSPGILLVQLKETMMDKMNTQLASMEVRSSHIMQSKFSNTTKGLCSTKVSVVCKYSTLSEKQVKKFKDAGIEVSGEKNALGRIKPDTFTLDGGNPISASEFAAETRSNVRFRSAVRTAYNPRFAGFSDKVWQSVSSKLGINKTKALPDGDDAAKKKAVEEDTKSGKKAPSAEDPIPCTGQGSNRKCGANGEIDPAQADAENAARAAANEALREAEESAEKTATRTLSKLGGSVIQGVGNVVKVTGYQDMACQAYTAVKTLGYAAKTIRAVQLARYAMVFLNTADQIKAGTATPEDVAYLGGILTNVAYDAASGAKRKAAMDSFGVKYAMFGDVGKSDSYLTQFMAGGGLTGDLIAVTNFIENALPGDVRGTCRVISNPFVQFGSFAAGIGLMFVPGVNIAISASDVAKGAAQVVLSLALIVLPDLLKDVVAGTVTKDLVGEDAGNAITSGSGSLMSSLAQAGGNATMSVDDAIAYTQTQNEVVAMYAEEEQATKSPFDPTSKYTFVGSIVNSILPYTAQFTKVSSAVTASFSVVGRALSSILPSTSAITTEQYRAAYTSCNDEDYKELGIATDPFCNVIFGIPSRYLDQDPVEVAQRLIDAGQIDSETGAVIGADFKKIVDKCIETDDPLGSGGQDGLGNIEDDKNCKINDTNADYYIYWVDQRIDTGFEADYDGGGGETATTSALPDGTESELAQAILDSGNVTDRTGQLQEIINGSRTNISSNLLQVIAAASSSNTFTISSMKRDTALSVGAGNKSLHLVGRAVDLSGSAGINGVSFGYNGHDDTIQAFLDSVAAVMPENCNIGVPNQAYVNATKPKVKSGCTVFVDIGSAAHIHLDVGSGS